MADAAGRDRTGERAGPATEPRARTRELARAQERRRKRIIGAVVGLVAVLAIGAGVLFVGRPGHDQPKRSPSPLVGAGQPSGASLDPSADPSASASAIAPPAPSGDVPDKGAGTFAFATGTGPVLGTAGNLRRFRVAVENGAGQDVGVFTAAVEKILGDPHGWTAGGTVRFQRVAQKSANEVTIYLATPATTDQLCAAGGLHVQKFLSCRLAGQIVINLGRWLTAVTDYGAPLDTYQQFALNHEVGRDLGYANEACPGNGQPAPVMQQQSLGLDGCTANPWPYPDGTLYRGRPLP